MYWSDLQPNCIDYEKKILFEEFLKGKLEDFLDENDIEIDDLDDDYEARREYLFLASHIRARIKYCDKNIEIYKEELSLMKDFYQHLPEFYDGYHADIEKNYTACKEAIEKYKGWVHRLVVNANVTFGINDVPKGGVDKNIYLPDKLMKCWEEKLFNSIEEHVYAYPDYSIPSYTPIDDESLEYVDMYIHRWNPKVKTKYSDDHTIAEDTNAIYWLDVDYGDYRRDWTGVFYHGEKETPQRKHYPFVGNRVDFGMGPTGIAYAGVRGYLRKGKGIGNQGYLANGFIESDRQETVMESDLLPPPRFQDYHYRLEDLDYQISSLEHNTNATKDRQTTKHDAAFSYYTPIVMSHFEHDIKHSFMLYPLDQGPFKTLPYSELCKLNIITELTPDSEKIEEEIEVYCTLPEWNKRITSKLISLEIASTNYQISKIPHEYNVNIISRLEQFANLQKIASDYNKELENVEEIDGLLESLKTLRESITDNVESAEHDTSNDYCLIAQAKEQMTLAAEDLFAILKNQKFLKELKRYLEHVKGKQLTKMDIPYTGEHAGTQPCVSRQLFCPVLTTIKMAG